METSKVGRAIMRGPDHSITVTLLARLPGCVHQSAFTQQTEFAGPITLRRFHSSARFGAAGCVHWGCPQMVN